MFKDGGKLKALKEFSSEAQATTWLLGQLRKTIVDAFIYKIPDVGVSLKPFDVMAIIGDKFHAIELKYITNKKITGPDHVYDLCESKLEPHQKITLEYVKNIGNVCYLVAYVKSEKTFYFFTYR